MKNGDHKNIYIYNEGNISAIPFEKAVKIFEASKTEQGILPVPDVHYKHVNYIIDAFEKEMVSPEILAGKDDKSDARTQTAVARLGNWLAGGIFVTDEAKQSAENLLPLLKNGTYNSLSNEIYQLRDEADAQKLEKDIIKLSQKYTSKIRRKAKKDTDPIEPKIIISETFV